MNPTVQKALELISKYKLEALARETELQDQARLCHQEAYELANLEYQLQQSQDEAKAAQFIKDVTLNEIATLEAL